MHSEREQAIPSNIPSHPELAGILNHLPSGVIYLDNGRVYRFISSKACDLLSVSPDHIIGKHVSELEQSDPQFYSLLSNCLESAGPCSFEINYLENTWLRVSVIPAPDGLVCFFEDISGIKQSESILRQSEAMYRIATESTSDVVWLMDLKTMKFIYVSPSVQKLRGYTPAEVIAQPVESALTPASNKLMEKLLIKNLSLIAQGKPENLRPVEMEQPHKDGTTVWTEVVVSYVFNENGKPVQIAGISRDISGRRKIEKQLHRLASTDELTGLCNRRVFNERAKKEIANAKRYRQTLSMLMLDIDNFKMINDRYGHVTGDRVLKALAKMMKKHMREVDLLGRLGGDEFVFMFPNTDGDQAFSAAERLRKYVDSAPVKAGDQLIHLTISIGVTRMAGAESSLDSLKTSADQALYQAKLGGRNLCVMYNPSLPFSY